MLYVIALTASKRFAAPSGYVKQEDLDLPSDMNIQGGEKKKITKVGNYFEASDDLFAEFDEESKLLSKTTASRSYKAPRVITVDDMLA